MIVIALHPHDLPTVREVAQPHFLRLAVADAYRGGRPIPLSVFEALEDVNRHSATLWAFYSPQAAAAWADTYQGARAAEVRLIVAELLAGDLAKAV